MDKDKLFDYLIATNHLDDFLGYEIPQEIKNYLEELAISFKKMNLQMKRFKILL